MYSKIRSWRKVDYEEEDDEHYCDFPMGSICVYNLTPDVTEAHIYEKFCHIGPILTIRVYRDRVNRCSLGYAQVDYQEATDAERAFETMHTELLDGKPIGVMWSGSVPSVRRSTRGKIVIKNLDKSLTNGQLFELFADFGEILFLNVPYYYQQKVDTPGESMGYGIVQYDTDQAAAKAIECMNDQFVKGKRICVGMFVEEDVAAWVAQAGSFIVSVKNLDASVDDEWLQKKFSAIGDISSAEVIVDANGHSRGFGFVRFLTYEGAVKAVSKLNNRILATKPLVVSLLPQMG